MEKCKRIVSTASINSEMELKNTIKESFMKLSCSKTFVKSRNRKFLNGSIII
ncbi:MAG: hypothetical protein ACYCPR_12475 [Thermoplasmataceae archaeon]